MAQIKIGFHCLRVGSWILCQAVEELGWLSCLYIWEQTDLLHKPLAAHNKILQVFLFQEEEQLLQDICELKHKVSPVPLPHWHGIQQAHDDGLDGIDRKVLGCKNSGQGLQAVLGGLPGHVPEDLNLCHSVGLRPHCAWDVGPSRLAADKDL